ncbi:MAG: NifU N-terminal domain-containing protein, partial [Acidimicrobiales bacterium]
MAGSAVDARRLVVERGLTLNAVTALTTHALGGLPFEALGPVKALLKRYFSSQDWTSSDDEALADAIGPGGGWWTEALDDGLTLGFGWEGTRFRLQLSAAGAPAQPPAGPGPAGLEATFDGPIAPEATPNPRSLVFRTGPLHDGDSRSYRSAEEAADDPRVARLFDRFPDLATALVARDFVALTLRRADRWEALLAPVLAAVTDEFAGAGPVAGPPPCLPGGATADVTGASIQGPAGGPAPAGGRRETRLDRAWRELGGLRADDAADLDRILAAAADEDLSRRQVAAELVGAGPPDGERRGWEGISAE